jgi:hypothetical protein
MSRNEPRRTANVSNMAPDRWLEWFLRGEGRVLLVTEGLWKKPEYIAADLGPEGVEAAHAAYVLGGMKAAWEVIRLTLVVRDQPPPSQPIVRDVIEEVNAPSTRWMQVAQRPRWRKKETPFGKFHRDDE